MPSQFQLHRQKWADCQLCPLCETRTHVVLARGSVPCDVLFIGEAPGLSEDVLGSPFVGPAGKLLDEIIRVSIGDFIWPGVTDENDNDVPITWGFTNLVACIPRGDDGAKFTEPPEESIKACRQRLDEFIAISQPKLIVRVGTLSQKWLTQSAADHTCNIVHPAAILRADVTQRGLMRQRAAVALRDAVAEMLV